MAGVGRSVWGRAREWPPTGGGEGGEYSLIAMVTTKCPSEQAVSSDLI